MRNIQMMDAVTANESSAIQSILGGFQTTYNVQVIATGTYTVVIEGSFDGVTFFTLDSMTSNEIASVLACPYMRCTTSGMSAASVNVFLGVF